MDPDRIEFRQGLVVLTGAGAGFAGTLLLPVHPAAAWIAAALAAGAALAFLRGDDPVDAAMAGRVRLSFSCAFGLVLLRLLAGPAEWEGWMPPASAAALFVFTLPFLPSRRQRGRLARAFPPEEPPVAPPPVGRGWWWGYWLSLGALLSLGLKVIGPWGWAGAFALLLAAAGPLLPLRRLAKRWEARDRERSPSGGRGGSLFPEGPA